MSAGVDKHRRCPGSGANVNPNPRMTMGDRYQRCPACGLGVKVSRYGVVLPHHPTTDRTHQ